MPKAKYHLFFFLALFLFPQILLAQDMIQGMTSPGEDDLSKAMETGLIRAATSDDINAFKIAEAKALGLPGKLIKNSLKLEDEYYYRHYVILSAKFVPPRPPQSNYKVAFIIHEGLYTTRPPEFLRYRIYSYDNLKQLKEQRSVLPQMDEACSSLRMPDHLPGEGKVYAVGQYSTGPLGERLNFSIDDQDTSQAYLMRITVNSPAEAVFLMLNSKNSTIWHFNWTPGTKIAGVFISGHGQQAISGLSPDVPVLNNEIRANKSGAEGPCRWLSFSSQALDLVAANNFARHLFNRDIEQVHYLNSVSEFVLGEPLKSGITLENAEEFTPEKFRAHRPLFGQAGLDEALTKGWIRKGTPQDEEDWWLARYNREKQEKIDKGIPESSIPEFEHKPSSYAGGADFYYILSPQFAIPVMDEGSKIIIFYLPVGMPTPKVYSEHHYSVHFLEDGTYCSSPGPCSFRR